MPCCRAVKDGVIVAVRLTPKASRDSLDGIGRLADGSEVVMARVKALPAKGAANGALVALFAGVLKISRQSVTIVGGAGARLKRVRIAGDAGLLSGKIEQWPKLS